MAILFADNFQNYGTDLSKLLDGLYAEAGVTNPSTYGLVTDPEPGVDTRCIFFNGNENSSSAPYWGGIDRVRYNLGGAYTTLGISFRVWPTSLPSSDAHLGGWAFTNSDNEAQISVRLKSNGAWEVARGNHNPSPAGGGTQGTVIGTSSPAMVAGSWQHVECKVVFDNSVGSVEIRVQGVTVLNLTGVDTLNSLPESCSQVYIGSGSTSGNPGGHLYFKDFIIWDSAGTQNNDFLGSVHVYTLYPDGDVDVPWNKSNISVDGYTLIDEDTPNDADYIASDYVTNLALQSETIDNATWTKTGVTVTTNVSNDGNGAATLDRITEDSGTSAHSASQAYTFTADDYIYQMDVRDNGCGFARLEMADGTNTVGAQFNLSDGSISTQTSTLAEAELIGTGLWRLKIGHTMAAGSGSFTTYCLDTHAGSTSYLGDGSSGIEIGRALLVLKDSFTNTYLTTTTTTAGGINGEPSEFTLTDLPPDIVGVKALLPFYRATKSDGGDGNVQAALKSNGSTDLGANVPITASFAYYFDVSELSPDTGVAYTPLEVDSVTMQIDRTT